MVRGDTESMKTFLLLAYFAFPTCVFAQGGGAETFHEKARKNFLRLVAESTGTKENALEAFPSDENSDTTKALRTGDLYPFYCESRKSKKNVAHGFAGLTEDGQPLIAFTRYQTGGVTDRPGGLSELMRACEVLDRKKRLAPAETAKRLLWCLDPAEAGTSETMFDAKFVEQLGWTPPKEMGAPRYLPQKSGVMILFYTTSQGLTGTLNYHKYSVTVMEDYTTTHLREDL